jgi:hypothetical protein
MSSYDVGSAGANSGVAGVAGAGEATGASAWTTISPLDRPAPSTMLVPSIVQFKYSRRPAMFTYPVSLTIILTLLIVVNELFHSIVFVVCSFGFAF